jgi:hypothetical protein
LNVYKTSKKKGGGALHSPPGSLLRYGGRKGVSPVSSKLTAISGITLCIASAHARHVS